jgi:predicted ester cyclase
MAASHREIALEYVDVMWNRHDLEQGLSYLTPELAASGAVAHVTELFDAFSDLRVDILEPGPIAEGAHVVLRIAVSGTHDSADFGGVPPSGRQLRWESIRIFRFEDGKIAETWAMQDRMGLMEQLGAIESRAGEVHWAAGGNRSS